METGPESQPSPIPPHPSRSVDPVMVLRTRQPGGKEPDHSAAAGPLLNRLFWLVATIALVLAAWFVGPTLVEKYQMAATRGRVRAEYEHAVQVLRDAPLTNVSMAYQLVAEKIRPSVVSIQSVRRSGEIGQGSGIVMSADGYLMTNNHVLRDSRDRLAEGIQVTLYDRRTFLAELVGSDELTDIAVLRINASGLIPAEWGDSDQMKVGSMVWAVGSPYGLDQTVTYGILSGINREGESSQYQEFLQTDAAVNPGNSGGPLVNSEGKVIGVNTSIFGLQYQGISFAVPSSIAHHVYQQVRRTGHVTRGFLGVVPLWVNQNDRVRLSLPDMDGARIVSVADRSPAMRAGIRQDDVIRRWDGHAILHWRHLYRYVGMTQPDSVVQVELFRDGKPHALDVRIGEFSGL